MIGAVTLISTIGWVVSARKWFKGPQRLVSEEEAAELERQYRELHGGEHMPHDKVEFDHSVMEGLGAKA